MTTTAGQCRRHQLEGVQDVCASCDEEYCEQCLVYVRGPSQPPLCVQCALARSGVRSGSSSPKPGWRERRRQAKLDKRAEAAIGRARRRRGETASADRA